MIKKIKATPKILFIIDGLGAIYSAFLLGVLLVKFRQFFGIPSSTLYFLAIFPVFFAIYDLICYINITSKISPFLNGIAIINLMYCCLSFGSAYYHINSITIFGWLYILIEILIVGVLAIIELKVASATSTK